MKKGLVWFKNDLRLHDNEALNQAIDDCDELVLCFCIEKSIFEKTDLGFRKADINRFVFLEQSVENLQKNLEKIGGHLFIGNDSAVTTLPELVEKHQITDIFAEEEYASEELNLISEVQKSLPKINFHFYWGKTLYHKDDIPFEISNIPLTSKAYRIPAAKESEPRKTLKILAKIVSCNTIKSNKFPSYKDYGFTTKEYKTRNLI